MPAPSDPSRDELCDLVARIIAGDKVAEDEFVAVFRRRVYAIATVRTGNRAEAQDITQDVLVAVLEALRSGRIREPEKLPAFIHGVTRNLLNNHFRRKSRLAETTLDAANNFCSDPVPLFEDAEKRRLIREEVAACNPVDQKILLFSMVDGFSLAVIAERLKLSHEAVRARKSRLIKKLAKRFEELSQNSAEEPLD